MGKAARQAPTHHLARLLSDRDPDVQNTAVWFCWTGRELRAARWLRGGTDGPSVSAAQPLLTL